MITGAARAEAALLVIDAAEGVQENSRRHGYMVSLLGIRQLAVVVNKMDLVGWDRGGLRPDRAGVRRVPRPGRHPAVGLHPGLGARRRQHRRPLGRAALVRRARRCSMRWTQFHTEPRAGGPAVPDAGPGRLQVHQAGRRPAHRRGHDRLRRRAAWATRWSSTPRARRAGSRPSRPSTGRRRPRAEAGWAVGFTLQEQIYITRGELATAGARAPARRSPPGSASASSGWARTRW